MSCEVSEVFNLARFRSLPWDGVGMLGFKVLHGQVGDCQNYGPFLGPYYNTGPNTGLI